MLHPTELLKQSAVPATSRARRNAYPRKTLFNRAASERSDHDARIPSRFQLKPSEVRVDARAEIPLPAMPLGRLVGDTSGNAMMLVARLAGVDRGRRVSDSTCPVVHVETRVAVCGRPGGARRSVGEGQQHRFRSAHLSRLARCRNITPTSRASVIRQRPEHLDRQLQRPYQQQRAGDGDRQQGAAVFQHVPGARPDHFGDCPGHLELLGGLPRLPARARSVGERCVRLRGQRQRQLNLWRRGPLRCRARP